MVYALSAEETAYYHDLEENFTAYIHAYRDRQEKLLSEGRKDILLKEREHLTHYRDGILAGNITDIRVNIEYKYAKLNILDQLLPKEPKTYNREQHELTRPQLRALAQACNSLYNDRTGAVTDTFAFGQRILNTITDAHGNLIENIGIRLAHGEDGKVLAFFNDHNARLASSTVTKATLTRINGRARIASKHPLHEEDQHNALISLSRHLKHFL